MDWASLSYAGSFLVGFALGVLTAIRITKAVFTLERRERNHDAR